MANFDPGADLQLALIEHLRNDAALRELVVARIYDEPPENAVLPYVSLGEGTCTPERGDGYDAASTDQIIDIWTAGPGFVMARRIAAALRAALDDADLAINNHRCVLCETQDVSFARPDGEMMDGIGAYGALNVRIQSEPEN